MSKEVSYSLRFGERAKVRVCARLQAMSLDTVEYKQCCLKVCFCSDVAVLKAQRKIGQRMVLELCHLGSF